MPGADGLALPGLLGRVFAAVADRLAVGLTKGDDAAAFDGVTDGPLAAGATAGAGATLLEPAAPIGAAARETEETGALVGERLAVQAVTSMAGASPSKAAPASIRRMRAILPDRAPRRRYCRVRQAPV
jgi:hypothetical protein